MSYLDYQRDIEPFLQIPQLGERAPILRVPEPPAGTLNAGVIEDIILAQFKQDNEQDPTYNALTQDEANQGGLIKIMSDIIEHLPVPDHSISEVSHRILFESVWGTSTQQVKGVEEKYRVTTDEGINIIALHLHLTEEEIGRLEGYPLYKTQLTTSS